MDAKELLEDIKPNGYQEKLANLYIEICDRFADGKNINIVDYYSKAIDILRSQFYNRDFNRILIVYVIQVRAMQYAGMYWETKDNVYKEKSKKDIKDALKVYNDLDNDEKVLGADLKDKIDNIIIILES